MRSQSFTRKTTKDKVRICVTLLISMNRRGGSPVKLMLSRDVCVHFCITLKSKGREPICLKTLCDIFCITPRRIQVLQDKIKGGKSSSDECGIHKNRPHAITDNTKQQIWEHINSFPRQESHYSRNKTKNGFLCPDLNLAKMFRLFQEKFPNTNINRRTYEDIFRSDFNLKFGLPRSDTCKYCDGLFIKLISADSDEKRREIETESCLHHMKADQAYCSLRSDIEKAKNNSPYVVLCKDLQHVLCCPTLKHSTIFYQRQLSCYNVAIHNMGTNDASTHLWYECIAKRGSSEVASCMLHYIRSNYKPLPIGEERTLVVWSDRCIGQNNNWKLITLYQYFVRCGIFTNVEQKFLCSGHSFLQCDRDFALIEKRKKIQSVMVPSEWKLNKPFTIVEMEQHDFKDFSPLESSIKKPQKLKITKVMWVQFTDDDVSTVRVRSSHNALKPWEQYTVTKFKLNQPPPLIDNFEPLYHNFLPVTYEKKKDLLSMCPLLKPEYREFYENLPGGPVSDSVATK